MPFRKTWKQLEAEVTPDKQDIDALDSAFEQVKELVSETFSNKVTVVKGGSYGKGTILKKRCVAYSHFLNYSHIINRPFSCVDLKLMWLQSLMISPSKRWNPIEIEWIRFCKDKKTWR
jgi:hypothetical protein